MTAIYAQPIDTGGQLTSVLVYSAQLGWPHAPQALEMRDVLMLAVPPLAPHTPARLVGRCFFGHSIGFSYCGIVRHARGRRPERYRVDFRIWEDGSYVMTRGRK